MPIHNAHRKSEYYHYPNYILFKCIRYIIYIHIPIYCHTSACLNLNLLLVSIIGYQVTELGKSELITYTITQKLKIFFPRVGGLVFKWLWVRITVLRRKQVKWV